MTTMDSGDCLLAFIGAEDGKHRLDQVRIMKGLFLLSKEGPPELEGLYEFTPYAYGPFDKQVYRDLDHLEFSGLVASDPVLGTNRRLFRLTERGRSRNEEVRSGAAGHVVEAIDETKRLVTSMNFLQLLRYVYERHPKYASKSVIGA